MATLRYEILVPAGAVPPAPTMGTVRGEVEAEMVTVFQTGLILGGRVPPPPHGKGGQENDARALLSAAERCWLCTGRARGESARGARRLVVGVFMMLLL